MTGRIDKQIASEMGISLGTVRVYWKRIRQKVGGTRSEVIAELARTSLKLDYDGTRKKADSLERELEASIERERALGVYESAFENLPIPLAIFDAPDGRLLRVNPPFAERLGYDVDEMKGEPVRRLMDAKDATRFAIQARKAAKEGKPFEGPFNMIRKDGSDFEAKVSAFGDGASSWVMAVQP